MSAEHIIEVNQELDKRIQLRRLSDISNRQKAEKFDRLIEDAENNFNFYRQKFAEEFEKDDSKQSRNLLGWNEGLMHMAAVILRTAGRKPKCLCTLCEEKKA